MGLVISVQSPLPFWGWWLILSVYLLNVPNCYIPLKAALKWLATLGNAINGSGNSVFLILLCLYPPVNEHSHGKSPSFLVNTIKMVYVSMAMLVYRSVDVANLVVQLPNRLLNAYWHPGKGDKFARFFFGGANYEPTCHGRSPQIWEVFVKLVEAGGLFLM